VSVSRTLRTPADLVAACLISPDRLPDLERVAAQYAVSVTPVMAELMTSNDVTHAMARQFLPDPSELDISDGERADPIGDDAHQVAPGLVHRYPDRALLKLANVCAVYCRYCFRREMV
jgi:lysine 2,3-aminomutase